jgi:hypothetical protein
MVQRRRTGKYCALCHDEIEPEESYGPTTSFRMIIDNQKSKDVVCPVCNDDLKTIETGYTDTTRSKAACTRFWATFLLVSVPMIVAAVLIGVLCAARSCGPNCSQAGCVGAVCVLAVFTFTFLITFPMGFWAIRSIKVDNTRRGFAFQIRKKRGPPWAGKTIMWGHEDRPAARSASSSASETELTEIGHPQGTG